MPRVNRDNLNQLINKFNVLKEAYTTDTPRVDLTTVTENYNKWNKSRVWLMRHKEQHLDKEQYEYVLASTHDHGKKSSVSGVLRSQFAKKVLLKYLQDVFYYVNSYFMTWSRIHPVDRFQKVLFIIKSGAH